MKCACWLGPHRIEIIERPEPKLKSGEVLIQVESVGVCGSDIHYYLEGKIGDQVVTPPLVLGHEFSGIVCDTQEEKHKHLLGKRVAVEPGFACGACEFCKTGHYNVCTNMRFLGGPGCDGALSEYIAVPAEYCFPVPESMPADIASMVEPTAVALHAVELASIRPGETALVVGLGSLGLLTAQFLLNSGASFVAGIDIIPHRTEVARQLGIHNTLTAPLQNNIEESIYWIKQITGSRGFDVTFDCSNRSEGLVIACLGTRPAGRSVLVGISGGDYDRIPVSVARRRELKLQWCRRFRYNFPATIKLIEQSKIKFGPILTHHFQPEQTQIAFEMVSKVEDELIKASIDWV